MTSRITTRYVPATTVAAHNAGRARYGIEPSKNGSVQELLVSPQMQKAVSAAAADVAEVARALAAAELTSASSTGAYEESIDSQVIEPIVAQGFPRASAAVTANGGRSSWGGFDNPESSHAAVVEFGLDPAAQAKAGPRTDPPPRILGRAGAPFHNPKA